MRTSICTGQGRGGGGGGRSGHASPTTIVERSACGASAPQCLAGRGGGCAPPGRRVHQCTSGRPHLVGAAADATSLYHSKNEKQGLSTATNHLPTLSSWAKLCGKRRRMASTFCSGASPLARPSFRPARGEACTEAACPRGDTAGLLPLLPLATGCGTSCGGGAGCTHVGRQVCGSRTGCGHCGVPGVGQASGLTAAQAVPSPAGTKRPGMGTGITVAPAAAASASSPAAAPSPKGVAGSRGMA